MCEDFANYGECIHDGECFKFYDAADDAPWQWQAEQDADLASALEDSDE